LPDAVCLWAAVAIFVLAFGCAQPIAQLQVGAGERKSVFIVNYGWHTAVVVKRTDAELLLPVSRDFADSEYLEFGWGDADYYPAPDAGLALTLKAAFWSRGSVLHVAGLSGALENYFPTKDIVEIVVTEDGFQRVAEFISNTFARPSAEPRPGLSPKSRFYSANGKFHVFRNCNTWVAQALRAGGLPISGSIVTAGGLMNQVRRLNKSENDQSARAR
jgi:uncharacterized protein (TIGR02117 family)